jgi:hypothetical protein
MGEPAKEVEVAFGLLGEWRAALRGDWGSIDGRSSRSELESWEAIMRAAMDGNPVDVSRARELMGLCPHGGAHWSNNCEWPKCGTP